MATVIIKVEGSSIEAKPDLVKVNRGKREKVEWICHDGRFEIDFGLESPFPSGKYGGTKGAPHESGPCRSNAALGKYKYSIRVWLSAEGGVFVDPGVDVWDDGGDPKPGTTTRSISGESDTSSKA
jgi:hypothetical protein